jgi:hypothetical protein
MIKEGKEFEDGNTWQTKHLRMSCSTCLKKKEFARCQGLTPIILGTWEAEIRRIMVQGQPVQRETPIAKK